MSKFKAAPESVETASEKKMPKWMNGRTEAEIAKIQARIADRKDRRAKAVETLREFIRAYGDESAVKAARVLFPEHVAGVKRERTSRVTASQFLRSLFPEVGATVSEMDIFSQFQLGRAEMRGQIIRALKQTADPAERLWVAFDAGSKSYTLKAVGANPPADWTGYKPVSVDGQEIL